MASIMCVDANFDSEEREVGSDYDAKRSALEVLESEISDADGEIKWLELEELGVDDVMLPSLDLSAKCPCFSGNGLGDRILQELPNLEIYNSKFTTNFGEWALGFCGGVFDKENPGSLDLPDRPLQQVTDLDLSDRCIQNLFNKVRPIPGVSIGFTALCPYAE